MDEGPVTFLKEKKDDFILEVVEGNIPQMKTVIRAGNSRAILEKLKHEPAEAVEIEAAIADIEEMLMSVIHELPERRFLVTAEQAFWDIAVVVGYEGEARVDLEIDTIEDIFNRLVDVAYGTPINMLKVPESREFAGTTIFLRELMHHAGFNTVHFIQ